MLRFNPWWGCEKLSEACTHCYAERDAKRWGGNYWGRDADRRFFDERHWLMPEEWNRKARKLGKSTKVFCGSMCDVFEERADLVEERRKLWTLIEDTDSLTWLLLTKRPQNITKMIPFDWKWNVDMPDNVWFGTTVENQHHVDRLIEMAELKKWTDNIFVSVEPMLGPVDFGELWDIPRWVIVGGESGIGARHMGLAWVYELKEACKAWSVPFFMKQLGGFPDKHGDINEWPEDLRVQQFPVGLQPEV